MTASVNDHAWTSDNNDSPTTSDQPNSAHPSDETPGQCDRNRFQRNLDAPRGPDPVGALNRCHLSNWRFNPETVQFLSSKRPFCRPCLCPNATKQSILAKIHFFTRSQNLEGKITIFTVLKWGKGRNHYENHDLGRNH